jgi:lantibiotic modifying enzyme
MENSPSYRDELKTATAQVTETYIEDQWQNDLLNGRAGLLLALLKAAAVLDRDRETHLAKHCGETLLDQRIESPTGHSIWPVDGEPTHCTPGFAHGTTGIAYAFTRLVDATGDTKYLTAAKEVLAFESDRFNREENRWVEHTTRDHISNDSWCYGRAGIVLARLRIKQIASSIIPEPSIQTVVTDIDLDVTAATDQLCCGNAGAINTLLEAARTYDAPRYKQAATSAFTELLAKHDDRGLLQLNCHTPHRTNDALFQGISGVGYTAARLHAPDRVPDILSFQ